MGVLRGRAVAAVARLKTFDARAGVGPGVRCSIVMPVLNEGADLASTLQGLQALRAQGAELLLVDGGSADDSVALASGYADSVLTSPRGRALQMNAGAQAAAGEVLVFLHADTRLPVDGLQRIVDGLASSSRGWGRFDVRLNGAQWPLRVIERMMNWRSRLTGMVTGDQAMFVRADLFADVGGFPELPLMEDLAISKRLKRVSRPLCLRGPVTTSSRRWEQHGIARTVLLMWYLRLAWFCGADPASLARRYYRVNAL